MTMGHWRHSLLFILLTLTVTLLSLDRAVDTADAKNTATVSTTRKAAAKQCMCPCACKSPPPPPPKRPFPPPPSKKPLSPARKSPPPSPSTGPRVGLCPVFPPDNWWNVRVDGLPVASNSDTLISSIGRDSLSHPDFGTVWEGSPIGIPFNMVNASTQRRTASSWLYGDESDQVGYPVPPNAKVEAGSDAHLLMVDVDSCTLFELYAYSAAANGFSAGSGAVWDLRSNKMRPNGWTSADAAGLPIFPGLARYDEVAAGRIAHALRFTAQRTCSAYVYPASHYASSSSDSALPPMGLRVRLKKSFNISSFPPQAKVVLRALQEYGMMLADNGSPWFISGSPDPRWDDDDLSTIKTVPGSAYEVVDTSSIPQPASS